jgi:uncharacterized membrane protein YgdD (TMEM256/DUF423 family)
MGIQELGRSSAGRSALAVVIPIDALRHLFLLTSETIGPKSNRRATAQFRVGLAREEFAMWIQVAAISGTLAVVAGAFGAHGLKSRLTPDQLQSWATGAHYHLLHSVVLLALGLFAAYSGKSIKWPASLFVAGMLLFSGSIYLLLLTKMRWLGPVTPIGGLLLILGWLSLLRIGSD